MARKAEKDQLALLIDEVMEWKDYLSLVLSTKPAELVREACQVLEKHGCHVKELKSELYYVAFFDNLCSNLTVTCANMD